jgi:hypothetical protein
MMMLSKIEKMLHTPLCDDGIKLHDIVLYYILMLFHAVLAHIHECYIDRDRG